MKNKKTKVRKDVVIEVANRLENVMDWYKSGGNGEWKGDYSLEEIEEIIKLFCGK